MNMKFCKKCKHITTDEEGEPICSLYFEEIKKDADFLLDLNSTKLVEEYEKEYVPSNCPYQLEMLVLVDNE